MTMAHIYFTAERLSIGAGNWAQLQTLFQEMGTQPATEEETESPTSSFPAYINHWRDRLDGDAVLYESQFSPGEVSGLKFRQLLADEFGVPVDDIGQTITHEQYATTTTTVWTYDYNAVDRFIVRRFGGGGTWEESRLECLGYLAANRALWEEED